MVAKRRWSTWKKRIFNELNGVSGLVGVGGTAMTIAGLASPSSTTSTSISILGAALALGGIGYAVWEAVPPVMSSVENLVGKTIAINDIKDVYPQILTLAIVGPSRAGKTTLKNRLSFQERPQQRTQSATAYIVTVPTTPLSYLAVLDGGGERYSQQFKIAEPSDYLCIVLDHNISDIDPTLSDERLSEIRDFLNQVREHLVEVKAPRKRHIEFLINKRDLWQLANTEQQNRFKQFCDEQIQKWRDGNIADSVQVYHHSNDNGDDMTRLMRVLQNLLQK